MNDPKKENPSDELPSYEEAENLDATMVDMNLPKAKPPPPKPVDIGIDSQKKKADEKELEELLKKQKSLVNRLGLSNIFKKK